MRVNLKRDLHLSSEPDRDFLASELQQAGHSQESCARVLSCMSALGGELGPEWLKLYAPGIITVRTGPKGSTGLDFFGEVLPLAFALHHLRTVAGFGRLLQKLRMQAHDRLSALLEAVSSARYVTAGYSVELEPVISNGKRSDFSVRYQNQLIYFECKKENLHESSYWKNAQKYVSQLSSEVEHIADRPTGHRVDVILSKETLSQPRQRLIRKLLDIIRKRAFGQWEHIAGARLAVNPNTVHLDLPPMHIRHQVITVGTTSTELTEQNAWLQVLFSPFGSKEIRKVRTMLDEARGQLPRMGRGIIILDVFHTKAMLPVVEKRVVAPSYQHVAGVMLCGNGAWFVSNPLYASFPREFATLSVLGSL